MFYYLVKVNGQKCVATKSWKEARFYYETLVSIYGRDKVTFEQVDYTAL